MNENILNLVIKAQNLTNGVLKTVGNDLTGLKNKVQDLTKNGFESMGNSFNKVANGLTIGVGLLAGGMGVLGKSAIDNAGQFEQFRSTLTVMLGSQELANKRLQEYSDIGAKTPFELPQVVALGNQLQAIGKYSRDNVNMLGDLASAAGKPIDQVSGAFTKLATGQKGVAVDMFRDLLITTEDWTNATGKGITKSGELMATTEEMLAVLPKIMADKKFIGMMDEQSKTFVGKMSNLMDIWNSKLRDIGDKLLPILKPKIDELIAFIGSINIDSILSNLQNGFSNLQIIFEQLLIFFQPIIDKFNEFNTNSQLTNSILTGLAFTIGVLLVGAFGSLLLSMLPLALAAAPFVAIGLVVAGITLAFQNQSPILEFLLGIWTQLSTFLSGIFGPELQTFQSVWQNLTKIFESVVFYIQPLIAILYTLATQILQGVFYAIEQLRQPFNDFIQAVMNAARPIVDILAPAFVFIVGIIATILIPTFQILWAFVVQAFKGILEIITGVINMIGGGLNIFVGLVRGIFTGDFSQLIEGFKQLWEGLGQFLDGIITVLLSPFNAFIDGIINIFAGFDLAQTGIDLMTGLADGMSSMLSFALKPLNDLKNSILNVLGLQSQAHAGGSGASKPVSGKGGAWAKGGAFEGGNVVKFATGGIVSSPTNFGMSGGRTGLMGEAGPEAIMPLTRGSDGKLGVKASGGGESPNITINMNIGTLLGTERDRLDLVKMLEDALRKQLKLTA